MAKLPKAPAMPRMLTVRKVREGSIVFDPSRGKRLQFYANPEEPDEKKRKRIAYDVPSAPYWQRRLRDGAVELCKADGSALADAKVADLPDIGEAKKTTRK